MSCKRSLEEFTAHCQAVKYIFSTAIILCKFIFAKIFFANHVCLFILNKLSVLAQGNKIQTTSFEMRKVFKRKLCHSLIQTENRDFIQ
jgi:hypothetical protein